jgi:hypothetical protein
MCSLKLSFGLRSVPESGGVRMRKVAGNGPRCSQFDSDRYRASSWHAWFKGGVATGGSVPTGQKFKASAGAALALRRPGQREKRASAAGEWPHMHLTATSNEPGEWERCAWLRVFPCDLWPGWGRTIPAGGLHRSPEFSAR